MLALESVGHLSDDPGGKAFDDRGLADTRGRRSAPGCSGAAAQDLHHPFDLTLPADHGVGLVLPWRTG